MRGQIFVPPFTTAAGNLALVDARWALGEPSLVSTQTRFRSSVQMLSLQEHFDFTQATGPGSPRAVQM